MTAKKKKKKYIVAVDIGGTNTKIAVFRGRAISDRISFPTGLCRGKNELIKFTCFQIAELLNRKNIKKNEVLGIGMGLPGLIDYNTGMVHYLVNVRGWKDVPLKKIMKRITGLDTYVDNDVNVTTLAELYFGSAKGEKNAVCITLGTGIGGGLIMDGRLYRGGAFSAGEIGHVTVDLNGDKCNCGNKGCAEAYVGNKYLIRKVKKELKGKRNRVIEKLTQGNINRLTPDRLARAAAMGDAYSIRVWKQTGEYLGVALASVINILDPDRIVIGGGVANAGGFLFEPLIKTVKGRAMKIPANHVKISKSKLGDDAGLLGAATLVRMEKGIIKE
jgi:glucokinase